MVSYWRLLRVLNEESVMRIEIYCYLMLEEQTILMVICFEVREDTEYVKSDLLVIDKVKKLL